MKSGAADGALHFAVTSNVLVWIGNEKLVGMGIQVGANLSFDPTNARTRRSVSGLTPGPHPSDFM